MTSKRKTFVKTDLTIPTVEHVIQDGHAVIPGDVIPPTSTRIAFNVKSLHKQSFDFAQWYGVGIDQITYACQRQIERFLAKQDAELSVTTVISYCYQGLRCFLDYLVFRGAATNGELTLADIDRTIIDGFIGSFDGEDVELITKRTRYQSTKSVLKALSARGLINEVRGGENATFPLNPFPGSEKTLKGHTPLTVAERKAFAAALREAVEPIFNDDVEPTADLLAYAVLVIALHTGRNTTPLLEMSNDCLRSHPKADTTFLVLYKRRGHSTSKVAIREARTHAAEIESIPTVRPTVAALVRRVISLATLIRDEAPEQIRARIWLYRARRTGRGKLNVGEVTALNDATLAIAIRKLVERFNLVDADGRPLKINVSRLRKTFVNRLYEILEGDVATTAAAAGHTARVSQVSYLRPGENAKRNWRFLGLALTQELLTATLGATERTPVGGCSDPTNGEYAPKNKSEVCMSFLNCLRCRNYVVTADDLYRLFSFYWRIFAERARMDARRWKRQLGHIARLIDRDVVEVGLEKGIFKREIVEKQRERARKTPHPFWSGESAIVGLVGLGRT